MTFTRLVTELLTSMSATTPIRLTVEDIYPTDGGSAPCGFTTHLGELNLQPGDVVQLVTDDETIITSECQRNDHVPTEEGFIRIPSTIRKELGVSPGDPVWVSPSAE